MKKKYSFICLFLSYILFAFVTPVKAFEMYITNVENKGYKEGLEANLIIGVIGGSYENISFDIEFDSSKIEILSLSEKPMIEKKCTDLSTSPIKCTVKTELQSPGFDMFDVKIKIKDNLENGSTNIFIKNIKDNLGNPVQETGYTISYTGRSSNNNLNNVYFDSGELDKFFDKNITDYILLIPQGIKRINVSATSEDVTASISGLGDFEISENQTITVTSTAENGSQKKYKFKIKYNNYGLDNNALLKSLKVNIGEIKFDPNINKYELIVYDETTDISVEAIAQNESSMIEVNGIKKLNYGANLIIIKVISESGKTNEYLLNVINLSREANVEEILDGNNNLKGLTINGKKINVNKNILNYRYKSKDSSLKIDVTTESDKATTTVMGNNDLKNGSIVKLIVTAENGSSKEYSIEIVQNANSNLLLIISGCGIVVLCIVIFIKKRNN